MFSVGLAPAQAGAALAAIEILQREPERVARLRANAAIFLQAAKAAGLDTGTALNAAIVPVMIGVSSLAVILSNRLKERDISALPIIFPAVPEKQARLRFFICADHSEAQLREAATATAEELARLRRGEGIGRG